MPSEKVREYQSRRIVNIADWHQGVAAPNATDGQDSSVRYLLLWTTFNALYNVLDMPSRELRAPEEHTGRPRLAYRSESTRLEAVAETLATETPLLVSLLGQHKAFLREVSRRSPQVNQPDSADEIHYEVEGHPYVFRPKKAKGIASLDRRVILGDGHKVFEYSTLTGPVTEKRVRAHPAQFMRELVFVLYQIRNNVAHGGSAAFFSRGNKVADGAIAVLDSIVRYLLEHGELLVEAEDEDTSVAE